MPISSFKDPWFSTRTLPYGQHNITFEELPDGFVIDYMTIIPDNDTTLVERQLVVDDTDPALVYIGQWTRNITTTLPVQSDWELLGPDSSIYNATSFGGGFQETEDPRASVKFTFIGALPLITSHNSLKMFVGTRHIYKCVTFTIDGKDQDTEFGFNSYLTQANYLWSESAGLPPGNHVLAITFGDPFSTSDSRGGRFTLDYIIYTPSFSSLATQGDPISAVSSSIQTPLSTRQIGFPTTGTSSAISHSEDNSVLIGALVGTVVGILLVAFLVFVFRRRIATKKNQTTSRLVPDPYRGVPNSAAASLISQDPHIVESQGRSTGTDVAQVLPPDRPFPRLPDRLQRPSPATVDSPAVVGAVWLPSAEVRMDAIAAVNRAQRIQELANELQQEIVVDGRVVSPHSNVHSAGRQT
ncbi:hypothetical protein C0995_012831 [Termitomyces sp. Mi166|nr:hypothetical protein C0995_012831 [Termitomyces sp. Mi166\